MDVSKISGTPKSSIFNEVFHYKYHPFWGTSIFGNTHIYIFKYIYYIYISNDPNQKKSRISSFVHFPTKKNLKPPSHISRFLTAGRNDLLIDRAVKKREKVSGVDEEV